MKICFNHLPIYYCIQFLETIIVILDKNEYYITIPEYAKTTQAEQTKQKVDTGTDEQTEGVEEIRRGKGKDKGK